MCMCVNGCVVCAGVHVTEQMRRSQDNFEELVLSFHLVLLPVPCSWPGSFWQQQCWNYSQNWFFPGLFQRGKGRCRVLCTGEAPRLKAREPVGTLGAKYGP